MREDKTGYQVTTPHNPGALPLPYGADSASLPRNVSGTRFPHGLIGAESRRHVRGRPQTLGETRGILDRHAGPLPYIGRYRMGGIAKECNPAVAPFLDWLSIAGVVLDYVGRIGGLD